jgi:hypothetical protein
LNIVRVKKNIAADVLSRTNFENNTEVDSANTFKILVAKEGDGLDMRKLINRLPWEQGNDKELGKIVTALNKPPHVYEKHFSLYNNHLFHRTDEHSDDWRLCIPLTLIRELVKDCHIRYGHIGPKKCSEIF